MAEEWKGPTEQLDPFAYLIPKSYKPAMRTDGLIFADATMMDQVRKDFAPEQVANVATMPGIVGRSMAMLEIDIAVSMRTLARADLGDWRLAARPQIPGFPAHLEEVHLRPTTRYAE